MKTITLPVHGIELTLDEENPGGGSISSDLKEKCPCCGHDSCNIFIGEACDQSLRDNRPPAESEEEAASRIQFNAAMDGIESMILAHATAGIDVETPAYLEGIETAIDACGNNFS